MCPSSRTADEMYAGPQMVYVIHLSQQVGQIDFLGD